ncbi:MAG: carboxypeptidase regulatory-like domain-containing protein [Vicinamibacterales bacterium]
MATMGPAVALAQTATIAGDVSLLYRPNPLPGITVVLTDDTGTERGSQTTTGTGLFSFTGLPAGSYYLHTENDLGFTNEAHDDVLCPLRCTWPFFGTPIVLAPGATFHAYFTLDRGGVISGVVTDADTSVPLPGVGMRLIGLDTSDPPVIFETDIETNASGAYAFQGLPAGRYYVLTQTASGYADEIYDNVPCPGGLCYSGVLSGAGTPIHVALGETAGGRNFALDPGGHITGTITDAATMQPIAGACVYIVRIVAEWVLVAGSDCVDATGAYDVGGLPAGTYYAVADSTSSGHVPELYDDIPCLLETCLRQPTSVASGTPIVVAVGATVAGKDFALTTGGTIQGLVRDAATLAPLPNVDVRIVSRQGGSAQLAAYADTDDAGAYAVAGLPSGTYYAYTRDLRYRNEIYDDIPCQGSQCPLELLATTGTPIVVTAGAVTSGIDFGLRTDVPPIAPADLRATVANYTVTLSWDAPQSSPVASYLIEAGLTPGTTFISLPTVDRHFVASPVGPGRYFVRVRAVNVYGPGPASEEITIVVAPDGSDGAPPLAPGDPTGWMSGGRLTLVWFPPYEGPRPDRYVVDVGTATGVTNVVQMVVGANALIYYGVPPGVYFVRVRAVNAAGSSPPSSEVRLIAGDVLSPPYSPWNLASSVSGSTVWLTWGSPPWQGPVTSYLVRAGSAPGLSNLAQANTGNTATTAVFHDVPPGRYYVRVHALNAQGASVPSNEVLVVVP